MTRLSLACRTLHILLVFLAVTQSTYAGGGDHSGPGHGGHDGPGHDGPGHGGPDRCLDGWRPHPPGPSSPSDFWLEKIQHRGIAPFHPDKDNYKVFRNVKDYGAIGDGITDDTEAINRAINEGGRCGGGPGSCKSSTFSPALVYFPSGTYLVSKSITPYYYTQLVGNPRQLPTLLAAPNFDGFGVIDVNPYFAGGAQTWEATLNFHRTIRNFVIDLRQTPSNSSTMGIHWQVAQATSLTNIVFEMSRAEDTGHQGVWTENGSGGYMGDMIFNGGKYGIWGGNQQFTVRNVTFNNVKTGIFSLWNWGWTYQRATFNNCSIGMEYQNDGTAAHAFIDAVVKDTPVFIQMLEPSPSLHGSIVLNNVKLTRVPIAVRVKDGATVLAGGTTVIQSWGQGNIYQGTNPVGTYKQSNIPAHAKHHSLLDAGGRIVGRTRPQYIDNDVRDFVSARAHGAKGDGVTDDTLALQRLINRYAACKIIFLDAGYYIVTDTLRIPAGTRLVGEAWSVIAGRGPAFQSQQHPKVVVQVGKEGSQGVIEITDIVFSTVGPAGGAIVVQWNVKQPYGVQAGAGMWDSHIRIGGVRGTNLESSQCPKIHTGPYEPCMANFLSLHITKQATGYFEGTWVWVADHDFETDTNLAQLSIYAGRGILSESAGPVWMIGTAEHHVLYQYNIVNAGAHYMGLIQTETPYFQPTPNAPTPFTLSAAFKDPVPYSDAKVSSWAVNIKKSQDILVFGAGLYSFFDSYGPICVDTKTCQSQILNVDKESSVDIYSLATVGTTWQLSVNGVGVVNYLTNQAGFSSTMTHWRRGSFGPGGPGGPGPGNHRRQISHLNRNTF